MTSQKKKKSKKFFKQKQTEEKIFSEKFHFLKKGKNISMKSK